MRLANCKRCGAPIRWVPLGKNRTLYPFEDSSDPSGTWDLTGGVAWELSPEAAQQRAHEGVVLFKAHPADCTRRRGSRCPDDVRALLGLAPRS